MRLSGALQQPKVQAILPAVVLTLAGSAYLWEVLSLAGIPVARDMQMFFVPQKHLLAEALRSGSVPLWTPYIGTGSPFLANVQSGVFYPPHWLYAVLPFYSAFNLLIVFHFVLGGLFAYLLCRRLGMGTVAAYVGAAGWMFGGYFASLLNLVNALQGAAWAPGLAWAALRLLEERSHRRAGALIVIAACAILAGEPQSFVFACLATGVVLTLAWVRRGSWEGLPAYGGWLAASGIAVVGLVTIQLLPTLELLDVSGRSGGLTYGEAAAFDLHPARTIHFLIPPDYRDPDYAFGVRNVIGRGDPWLFSVYLGALFPLLAYFAARNRNRRREVVTWAVIAVASVVIALGENTPVFPWLFENVPGFGSFRFPEKYLFGTAFGAMLIGGWGAERLLDGERRRGDLVFASSYALIALIGYGAFRASREPLRRFAAGFGNDRMMSDFGFAYGVWSQNVLKLALLALLAAVLIWLWRRKTLTTPVFAALFAALVTADLVVAHRTLNPVVERSFYESEPLLFRHVPLEEVRRDYRLRTSRFDSIAGSVPVIRGVPLEAQKWLWQQISAPNVGQTWGVLQQDAWDAIKLGGFRDEQQLQRAIPDAARRWALLRLHSVKYVHSILRLDHEDFARQIPLDTLSGHLYELHRPLPRAYVAERAEWYPDEVAVINRVLSSDFDPTRTVALMDSSVAGSRDEPIAAADEAGPSPAGASISRSEAHEVTVRLDGPVGSGSWLVLTDSYYPGWTARVDGRPRPIEIANMFFRAVRLEPGDREVAFTYRSVAFERGRQISIATLAVVAVLFGIAEARVRRRRRSV